MNKDVAKLIKSLRKQRAEVTQNRGSKHYTVRKDGRRVATIPSTPSDYRGWKNTLAYLRAAGYDV